MSRICQLTAVKVQYGHNVSHSERKTNRVFRPNLKKKRLFSDALNMFVSMRITPRALRTLESKGGLDDYLLKAKNRVLSNKAKKMKKALSLKIEQKI